MKTICIVIGHLGVHGPSLIRLQIAAELVKRGFDVHIVIGIDSGSLTRNIPEGCKPFTLGVARPREFILKFGKYLRKEKPDAVLASSWPFSVSAILAARLFTRSVKVVVSEHADFRTNIEASGEFTRKDAWLIKHLSKYVYNLANRVVGVSQGVVDGIIDVTGLNKDKTVVIYNPLRQLSGVSPLDKIELALRDDFWTGASIKLLAVGRLAPQKNYDVMIDAISILKQKHDIKLIIVGEGSLRSRLQEKIIDLSLEKNILLAGQINNVGSYYLKADVFLISSSSEGFGNVIVEALSFGLPIISTDCQSGPAEILQNGRYGVLTPVGDAQAFAFGIEQILESPVNHQKQKQRSQEFSIEKATDQYLSALFPN